MIPGKPSEVTRTPSCPVCASGASDAILVWDDRYGHPGEFPLHACSSCGHRWLMIGPGQIDEDRLYSDWYPRRSFDLEHWQANRRHGGWRGWWTGETASAFTHVPAGVRILDVGTGWGESLGYHAARGCTVTGIDADDNLRRVAKAYGFDVHIGLFTDGLFPASSFDWITLDQVVEHLPDPVAALRTARTLLRPGGHVIVTTPNGRSLLARLLGRRWVHAHAPYHRHLFSVDSLRLAATAAGLSVVRERSATNSAWYHFQWMHLIALRPAGRKSPYWSREVPFRLGEQCLRIAVAAAHRLGCNHLLARLLDLMGCGDNRIMILRASDARG